ncbi:MAG: GxxExxY protein [Planctomycetes bacterium]|nr:GxxExxY protein [Planctomycetota bacterium]
MAQSEGRGDWDAGERVGINQFNHGDTERHGEDKEGERSVLIHEELTSEIIGAAIEVHRELGPGLLESAYQVCMCREFSLRSIPFEQKVPLAVEYKGVKLECAYEMDFRVDRKVVVDLKAVSKMLPVFEAQLHTYLKLSKCRVGLLINFHVLVLKNGIIRRAL